MKEAENVLKVYNGKDLVYVGPLKFFSFDRKVKNRLELKDEIITKYCWTARIEFLLYDKSKIDFMASCHDDRNFLEVKIEAENQNCSGKFFVREIGYDYCGLEEFRVVKMFCEELDGSIRTIVEKKYDN